jgi:hypothetical protein
MQPILRYYFRLLRGHLRRIRNKHRSVKAIFSDIYYGKRWGDRESVSGTGSKLEQTRVIIDHLPRLFQEHGIHTFLDVPCGDFNWMKHVELSGINYYGGDIIDDLIKRNTNQYGTETINFFLVDLTQDTIPKVDMILCRDCLVHFSNHHIGLALQNIKKSSSTFLLTTTFPEHKNTDIVTGDWRELNLQEAPFHFPKPLAILNEGYHKKNGEKGDKSLGLWRIADLP